MLSWQSFLLYSLTILLKLSQSMQKMLKKYTKLLLKHCRFYIKYRKSPKDIEKPKK